MKQKNKDIIKGIFLGSGLTIFAIYLIIKKLQGNYICHLDCKKINPILVKPKIKD